MRNDRRRDFSLVVEHSKNDREDDADAGADQSSSGPDCHPHRLDRRTVRAERIPQEALGAGVASTDLARLSGIPHVERGHQPESGGENGEEHGEYEGDRVIRPRRLSNAHRNIMHRFARLGEGLWSMVSLRLASRMVLTSVVLTSALFVSACEGSFPDAPASAGEDYPSGGVPTSAMWPSDWLEGFSGEEDSPRGPIVGLRLEYVRDQWVWRVRSVAPGREGPADRGREALYDASTLAFKQERNVALSDGEVVVVSVGATEAARLSGETYPSPRLIALDLGVVDGRPVWNITTCDTETGAQSTATEAADS
ncbi:hypothetical protein [Rathayibacter sp. PhB127]|uniref:hypothetical protein n=1 Tax=Rathayibacter sp. PhB127 TaxID=2485176 RepID=UPI0011CE018F|nr:hypothetical protein [Rathayibacter sp. PhB127]